MNEYDIDNFISGIQEELNYVKALEKEEVVLTSSQEETLKKLPKTKQEEQKKEFLEKNKAEKKERLVLLLRTVEDKIKNSSLPDVAKKELGSVMDKIKSQDSWTVSPQTMEKVQEIKDEDMTKKQQERDAFENTIAEVGSLATSGIVATGFTGGISSIPLAIAVANVDIEKESLAIASVPFLGLLLKMPKESLEKAQNVAHKAFENVTEQEKPLTLLNIELSDKLNNMEKKVARAVYLVENTDGLKNLQNEEAYYQEKALLSSTRKYLEAQAKSEGGVLPQQKNHIPDYTQEERALVKLINRIKQRKGHLNSENIKIELMKFENGESLVQQYEVFFQKHIQNKITTLKLTTLRDDYHRQQITEQEGKPTNSQERADFSMPRSGLLSKLAEHVFSQEIQETTPQNNKKPEKTRKKRRKEKGEKRKNESKTLTERFYQGQIIPEKQAVVDFSLNPDGMPFQHKKTEQSQTLTDLFYRRKQRGNAA